jgi:hypothetical protein
MGMYCTPRKDSDALTMFRHHKGNARFRMDQFRLAKHNGIDAQGHLDAAIRHTILALHWMRAKKRDNSTSN